MAFGIDSLLAKSLIELREYCFRPGYSIQNDLLEALDKDPRYGARHLAIQLRKQKQKNQRESRRLDSLLRFELELWNQGIQHIAGVDEAGMAPLAGPVIAAAVILPRHYKLPGLDDSKKIVDEHKREALALRIKEDAVCWSVGRADVEEIDSLNIYHSGLLAMQRAVAGLITQPQYVLVDARTIPHCACPQKGIIHGDALSASIAAASIIAKTTRDAHMVEQDRIYGGYGFASHKGYPTPEHLRVLKARGPLPIHRKSFAPVREALGLHPIQGDLFPNSS